MENPIKMDNFGGNTPIFGLTPISTKTVWNTAKIIVQKSPGGLRLLRARLSGSRSTVRVPILRPIEVKG